MCKYKRIIAVEVVDNMVIHRNVNIRNRNDAIVVVSTNKDINILRILSYDSNSLSHNLIPWVAVLFKSNFIKKFKCYPAWMVRISLCHLLPKNIEVILKLSAVKETFLMLTCIKGISLCFMKVKNDINTCSKAPIYSIIKIFKAVLYKRTIFILNNIVIKRNSYVVKAKSLNLFYILLCNECIKMLFCIITL